MQKTIVWFRKDLRIHDHQALSEAVKRGIIIPIFIWSKDEEQYLTANAPSLWWLHHSLLALQQTFQKKYGVSIIIREGTSLDVLIDIIQETKADAVYFNERYEPAMIEIDQVIIHRLNIDKIEVRTFHSHLIFKPYSIFNLSGDPYKIFTPYWKKCLKEPIPRPFPIPRFIQADNQDVSTLSVEQLNLLSTIRSHKKFHQYWTPGENGAISAWEKFIDNGLDNYKFGRDFPHLNDVSRLSAHLAWGDISPKAIWYSADHFLQNSENIGCKAQLEEQVEAFKRQLVWRDFGYHQLIHFPNITHKPLREQFQAFPWEDNHQDFINWKKGMTGYPLIDAGMRELWETGTIHNRVRMVVASFLVKHLLIPWTKGAQWFQETLVDFDLANNSMGWQWASGCGLDSAPYFRIFNPMIQSEKFDKNGDYIRSWIPELAKLPFPYIHRPWDAPAHILESAKITLGETYPHKIIDHDFARKRALAGYEMIK